MGGGYNLLRDILQIQSRGCFNVFDGGQGVSIQAAGVTAPCRSGPGSSKPSTPGSGSGFRLQGVDFRGFGV